MSDDGDGWTKLPDGWWVAGVSPVLVSPDGIHWYEVPDDVPLSEFLASFSQPLPED